MGLWGITLFYILTIQIADNVTERGPPIAHPSVCLKNFEFSSNEFLVVIFSSNLRKINLLHVVGSLLCT